MSENGNLYGDQATVFNPHLVRFLVSWKCSLVKFPGLVQFVRRVILTGQLLREGHFWAHFHQYISYKKRLARIQVDVLTYGKVYLERLDPKGILNASGEDLTYLNADKICFPVVENPLVSIIIPCYGKVEYTLRCLSSLVAALPDASLEIIVAEDASGDPESAKLRKVRGITYIERDKNMGFLRSCNDAAQHARGTYIFLLNNDTYVLRGAIDALVRLLRARPDAGMVGARLLYPDGIQQEAGGIVWQDGSAWNYGRRDMAFKPEYCYVREADYISGAAIMLSRELWNKLGGFDEYYLPAYCEDSDLAFRIRSKGLKVLYQPEACVVHYEGVSHGTDTNTGIKAYQVENSRKLQERWKSVFEQEHFPSGTKIMRARDKALHRKITLVVDHYVPEPDRDAGARTIVSFIEALLDMGRIVKFWPDDHNATPLYTEALQQRGVEVLYGITASSFANWIKANGADIDEVLLSRPTVAPAYIPLLRQYTQAPIVFYGHDLHFSRMKLEAEITKDLSKFASSVLIKDTEISVWKGVDYSLYPSEEEVISIHKIDPTISAGSISPYALTVSAGHKSPPSNEVGILFVAGFAHTPNVDAALWFYRDVLPLIRAQKPGVKVTLVGSNPTDAVRALASDTITVTGFVSDTELADYYAKARVAIAPLRFGAGVKLKVVESMHAGVPIVTTPVGAQGLKALNGALEVCCDEKSFAASVLRFLDDDAAWAERSAKQVAYVNQYFSFESQKLGLESAFAKANENRQKRLNK